MLWLGDFRACPGGQLCCVVDIFDGLTWCGIQSGNRRFCGCAAALCSCRSTAPGRWSESLCRLQGCPPTGSNCCQQTSLCRGAGCQHGQQSCHRRPFKHPDDTPVVSAEHAEARCRRRLVRPAACGELHRPGRAAAPTERHCKRRSARAAADSGRLAHGAVDCMAQCAPASFRLGVTFSAQNERPLHRSASTERCVDEVVRQPALPKMVGGPSARGSAAKADQTADANPGQIKNSQS